jgi:MOSC domain-containing protein YiiM
VPSLVAIFVRPSARAPVQALDETAAVAGVGLEGDHAGGGARQVTLLAQQAWAAACAELGQPLPPSVRRANLVLDGIDLRESRGRVLRIGVCTVEIAGETRPCELLDSAAPGLSKALRPEWRGGAFGRILGGGKLAVGDPVAWVEPDA